MRLGLLMVALVVLVGCERGEAPKPKPSPAPAVKTKPPTVGDFDWQKDVLESPTPVLVDFWAAWCGPCIQMNPVVSRLGRDFKVVKVDIDQHGPLARSYNISSIPQFLIFANGQVVARHVGVTSESVLRADMNRWKQ